MVEWHDRLVHRVRSKTACIHSGEQVYLNDETPFEVQLTSAMAIETVPDTFPAHHRRNPCASTNRLNVDVTQLVPYPRIHILLWSHAFVILVKMVCYVQLSLAEFIMSVLQPASCWSRAFRSPASASTVLLPGEKQSGRADCQRDDHLDARRKESWMWARVCVPLLLHSRERTRCGGHAAFGRGSLFLQDYGVMLPFISGALVPAQCMCILHEMPRDNVFRVDVLTRQEAIQTETVNVLIGYVLVVHHFASSCRGVPVGSTCCLHSNSSRRGARSSSAFCQPGGCSTGGVCCSSAVVSTPLRFSTLCPAWTPGS